VKLLYSCLAMIVIIGLVASGAWALKADCGKQPNVPPKPAKEVNKEDVNTQSDYDKVVKENPKAIYLAVVNGDQPKPNACGLKPSNPATEWGGWGTPLDADNMTIGEGVGARNDIIIGGTLFERGVGTHAVAKFIYPLTGDAYKVFEGYAGMSDEKDPVECTFGGSSVFIFSIDGKEIFKSDLLKGTDAGKNVLPLKVSFDIPSGAKELQIDITDGGDGNCGDHACLGDAKLLTSSGMSVEPKNKATSLWGIIKSSY
jgi:hypothetical protein